MALATRNLILDTQYFVDRSFAFDTPEFKSLIDMDDNGLATVYLTDINVRDVRRKIKDALTTAHSKAHSNDIAFCGHKL